jgi:hypothetical protein
MADEEEVKVADNRLQIFSEVRGEKMTGGGGGLHATPFGVGIVNRFLYPLYLCFLGMKFKHQVSHYMPLLTYT